MKRKIITINDELCDGCGNCVSSCSEGALQIENGKAKLVKEDFCDGFGDCIGGCPTGAGREVKALRCRRQRITFSRQKEGSRVADGGGPEKRRPHEKNRCRAAVREYAQVFISNLARNRNMVIRAAADWPVSSSFATENPVL
jgi:ferredoxin